MSLRILAALALTIALARMPSAAFAHAGHDHGTKAKKVKKTKPKTAAIAFRILPSA